MARWRSWSLPGDRVCLQNYYNEDWANNFVMHITVDDARGRWEHASRVIGESGYGAARVREPSDLDDQAAVVACAPFVDAV